MEGPSLVPWTSVGPSGEPPGWTGAVAQAAPPLLPFFVFPASPRLFSGSLSPPRCAFVFTTPYK